MKEKNKYLFLVLFLALILIVLGVYLLMNNKSVTETPSNDNNPYINQPSMNQPQETTPSNTNSDTITEEDFTLKRENGWETGTIVQYNDDKTSDVYVLIANHDNTPLELKNFTLDIFSTEKEYLDSKKFDTITVPPNGNHILEWHLDIENVNPNQITWHIPNNG